VEQTADPRLDETVKFPQLKRLTGHRDGRGQLHVAELDELFGLRPARLFIVTGVPQGVARGGHALRRGHELMVCVAGSCNVECETGTVRQTFQLDDPGQALHVPPLVWLTYRPVSPATALVVLCSRPFDPAELITDRAEFSSITGDET